MPKAKSHLQKRVMLAGQLFMLSLFVGGMFLAVLNIQVVRQFFGRASGSPANLVIDVQSDLGPMPRPWRNLAQGGEAFDWKLDPIAGKVKSLNPDYIRIDHIYDFYDIVKRDGDQLTFDFSKLDPVLDGIKASGATPFISLSYMPTAIATTDIVSEPKNWAEWQLTVQKTIEHVSGTKAIPNVYYEVWNEPDLFGGWKRSGNKNYLTMYASAARGANDAKNVRPFKFGGPAITALYKNWFYDLLNMTRKNNMRMDFFSWHRYDKKIDQFEKDMSEVEQWIAQDFPEYQNLEMVISEWGHDSNNHAGYDTTFGAAHTVATAIQMVGVIDKGFVFEIEDGKDPAGQAQWGRWGLMTNQAFGAQPKPRYQALRMLDRIGETRLDLLGKGSFVKAVAARSLATDDVNMVIANYDQNFDNIETVPITFTNLIPGQYTFKQTFLGGRTSSENVATDAATLRTFVTMSANSVAFVELARTIAPPSSIPVEATSEPQAVTPTPTTAILISPTPLPIPTSSVSATPASGLGRLLEP